MPPEIRTASLRSLQTLKPSAPFSFHVFVPITCPKLLTRGPPEFPGLIGAVLMIWFSKTFMTFPIETDFSIPNGDPSAMVHQPGAGSSLISKAGRTSFVETIAKSFALSVLNNIASYWVVPLEVVTARSFPTQSLICDNL